MNSASMKGKGMFKSMPHPRTRIRKEVRAGLVFPISRIPRHLKRGQYAKKIGVGSAIYLAAVMEYLVAEVLELAGNLTSQIRFDGRKTKSIYPHHINIAIKNDPELNKFLKDIDIESGGVLPNIHPVLLKKNLKERTAYYQELKAGTISESGEPITMDTEPFSLPEPNLMETPEQTPKLKLQPFDLQFSESATTAPTTMEEDDETIHEKPSSKTKPRKKRWLKMEENYESTDDPGVDISQILS